MKNKHNHIEQTEVKTIEILKEYIDHLQNVVLKSDNPMADKEKAHRDIKAFKMAIVALQTL